MAGAAEQAPREKQVQTAAVRVLKRRRAWWQTTQSGGYGGKVGVPDLLICYRGIFLAAEVKRPLASSKLSTAQKVQLALIEQAGGRTAVVRSADDMTQVLDTIDGELDAA
jgi:hypothetical protein